MECIRPRSIKVRGLEVAVPCGKCIACRINRRREWTQRLLHEMAFSSSAYFVTLTYDEAHVPCVVDSDSGELLGYEVSKRDVQLFFKRLRREYPGSVVRYFCNSEYGTLGRPHYHAIIYNLPDSVFSGRAHRDKDGSVAWMYNTPLGPIWGKGEVTVSHVVRQRASYCAKYFVDRADSPDGMAKNFSLMSRRPGIGYQYANSISEKVRFLGSHSCLTDNGKYISMPRYYRNKIYSEEELQAQFNDWYFAEELTDPNKLCPGDPGYDIVESNIIRSQTWKHQKSKL